MKIIFKKPDFSFVGKTLQDLKSIDAWLKNKWFRHLAAVILIVFAFNFFGTFDKYNFIESFILQSIFYSVFFAVGWEFLQLGYIAIKEKRSLTEGELLASKKDWTATSLFFIISTLIIIPFFT